MLFPICSVISFSTLLVAVAVVAKTGKFCGKSFTRLVIRLKAGLKSCPQTEIQ